MDFDRWILMDGPPSPPTPGPSLTPLFASPYPTNICITYFEVYVSSNCFIMILIVLNFFMLFPFLILIDEI